MTSLLRGLPALFVLLIACGPKAAPQATPAGYDHDADPSSITLPEAGTAVLPVDPRVRHGVLDNGLHWYVEPNARPADRAELRLVVRAGSILEDDDQRGIAHFVEHMAFNGTEHFPGNELVVYLESIGVRFGAHINAYTSFDETVYQLQVPTDDPKLLESAILVMRDWADGVAFDPEECDREVGVVLEEWRLGQGVGARLQEATLPATFHGSRYLERLPIGTEQSLTHLDCDTARRFYADWYRPDLMAVMIVGDFDADQVEGWVHEWFDDLDNPRKERERTWYRVPDHDETLVTRFTDPEVTRSGIVMMDKVDSIEESDHDAYRRFLLQQLVWIMFNERLAIRGQDPEAPFLGAMASESALGHERAAQTLQVAPREGAELDGLRTVLEEVERMHRYGFTAGELRRAKQALSRNMDVYYLERDKTDSVTHIDELLRVYLTDEPMPGIPYEYAMATAYLPAIGLDEVNAFAVGDLFTGQSRVVQLYLPDKPGLAVPSEAEVLAAVAAAEAAELAPPVEDEDDTPLMAELPTPGTAEKVATDAALGTSTWTLSNGATVVLKTTDFQEDQILFEAVSPGGLSLVADEDYMPAVTAIPLLMASGVGELDAVAVAKKMAGRDLAVQPGLARTRETISGGASIDDLEVMLQLLHLMITQPRFSDDAFRRLKDARLEMLRNRAMDPDAVFEEAWSELVWDGNPRQTAWSMDDLDALDLARSEAVFRDRFGDLGDFTFVFVGSVDEDTLIPLLERYVASLPGGEREESWADDGARRIDGVHTLELPRGNTPRARLRILFHGPFESTWSTRSQLEAAGVILETRLSEVLREDLGGTYGVRVNEGSAMEPEGSYSVQIDFECDPARLDELRQATWDVIAEVRDTVWPGGAFATLREKNRRARETAVRTNGFWAGALAGAMARGEDPRDLLTFDARNDALTGEVVRDMLARVLDEDAYIEALQRPAE